ncbi:DNA-directed RNA polymerase [Prevotella salivae]|nr:DNA-directed RNA polymerase [Segatella salivae]MBW4906754.1 DNA-directed RNA polymerase [Segatella salivae]
MNHAINNKSTRISQRCKRCTFDSPGLPNNSAGYPGLAYDVWGTTL